MQLARHAAALLHRHVWQKLPVDLRRALFLRATTLLAPRPHHDCPPAEPIFVVGAFRTASGLGQSARLCYEALRGLGFATFGIDISSAQMQPQDLADYALVGDRAHRGPGTIILHVNAPLIPLALMALGRAFIAEKRIIGYWAWELPRVPADWRAGVPLVHEIWVPSRFTADAVSEIVQGRAVRVIPHPLPLPPLSAHNRHDHPFRVLVVFNCASGFERKNPCAAVAAFKRAFADDPGVELVIKSSNLTVYPAGRAALEREIGGRKNIRHIDATIPAAGLDALFADADVVLSLHRSEGFGLVLAEAMLHGLPVVATGWSGNVDFLNVDNGCPVRYVLVPAFDPQRLYHYPALRWAEPDTDHAAELLRRLRDDAALRSHLGGNARRTVANSLSPEAFAAQLSTALSLTPRISATIAPH
jgi:glycosyltransferase involved in cell wall biosynthesis